MTLKNNTLTTIMEISIKPEKSILIETNCKKFIKKQIKGLRQINENCTSKMTKGGEHIICKFQQGCGIAKTWSEY